ncbi:MAG: polymer-forming cytoskeletal protein [Candidatus Aminicenantaceae bacterium]
MDNKKKMLNSDKITGFFDKDTEIDGNLTFKGSFRIDGHFKGKIDSESILIIGEKGKVEADVNIGYIIINGEIKGNIQATEKVEINATGRVIGSVITPKLIVEEGAYLETSCQTSDQIPLPKTKKEKEVEQGYQS